MKKPFLSGAVAVATIAVAVFGWNAFRGSLNPSGPNVAQALPSRPAFKTLKLTPIEVKDQGSNVGALLGINMWRFEVQLPPNVTEVTFTLETEQKGEAPQFIASEHYFSSMGRPMNGKISVFVGAYPIPDLPGQPEKVKYMIRREPFRTDRKTEISSNSSSTVVANVFSVPGKLKSAQYGGDGTARKDGGLDLIQGYRSERADQQHQPDIELVLTARLSPF